MQLTTISLSPDTSVVGYIKQLLFPCVCFVSGGVSDIFKLAGLKSPDISILSEEFLSEIEKMPQKNLAVELLNRLINDEIKSK